MSAKDQAVKAAMNACFLDLDGAIITAGMMRDFHTALSAAGYVVVPREPTREMKNAAWMHVTTGLELGWDSTMTDLLKAALAATEAPDV